MCIMIGMKNKRALGNCILLFTALIWGTAFAFQRMGMDSIEPATFNAARMALAAAALGLATLFTRQKDQSQGAVESRESSGQYRRNTLRGGIACGVFLSLASLLQQQGMVYTTAGKAGFITAMYMLLVPLISWLLFRKKNTPLVWAAVLLGVTGMYFLCISGEFRLAQGDFLVLLCALFFSGHILCCDYFVQRGNPIRISAIQFATATLISLVWALATESPSLEKLSAALVPILYCGLISGGLGYTLQLVAQQFTDPTVASLLMSMESVFALTAGVILLQESMSRREFWGCLLMFAAIILVQLPGKRKDNVSS